MDNEMATIQCSNTACLTGNAYQNKFCSQCGTPIVKRYLRAMGDWIKAYRIGELIDDRYLLKPDHVILDTQPGNLPQTPHEIPSQILPYLKLFAYRLHLPQVYGYLPSSEPELNLDIWLLEYTSLPLTPTGDLQYDNFLPLLSELWQAAIPLRQLNWLWQMARLWQPLQSQGVTASLLNPELVRVNGAIVQLLELESDGDHVPSLRDLGKLWLQWVDHASGNIRDFLATLSQKLADGEISHPDRLIILLEQAIEHCARSQKRTYQVFTYTDAGPSREHNEDNCYPPSGEMTQIKEQGNVLTLVCDGVGGQDGGEIASQLAIETLLTTVNHFCLNSSPSDHSRSIVRDLEQAILTTNDFISDRNDQENRQNRQRMGTTLVMGFSHHHQMYCAHVGDSRIYWITPSNCYQVTVDDDLASREVKLGYLVYREAVQYPNSGSLVQAMGMNPSTSLHPNIESFVIDEDCVFLLCSDGLSDYDRVEQYWESEIVPILAQEKSISEVGKRLIQIGNEQNGHDNVTIGLIYAQVEPQAVENTHSLSFVEINASLPSSPQTDLTEEAEEISASMPTEPLSPHPLPQSKRPILSLLAIAVTLLGLAGVFLALGGNKLFSNQDLGETIPNQSLDPSPIPSAVPAPASLLYEGEFIKSLIELELTTLPQQTLDDTNPVKKVPPGEILKVLQKEPDESWVQLQICQPSEVTPPETQSQEDLATPVSPENTGWLQANTLQPSDFQEIPLPTDAIGDCTVSAPQ